MGRVADYVETLTPAERERFAALIEECTAREALIAACGSRAEASAARLEAEQREVRRGLGELRQLSETLEASVARLYLACVPAKGSIQ